MKKMKKHVLLLIILCIIFCINGCTKKPQKPSPKSENQPKPIPPVMKEIEKDILKIMSQADMVPYFERVIVEKQKIEEQQKIEKIQMAKTDEDQKKKEGSSSNTGEQAKPKPMTIEESILADILKKENVASDESEKPPKDITETWKKINTTIVGIHGKWNVLEPLLVQQSVSPDIIANFEETLDRLTNHGINKNYFSTINTANTLTSYLPKFMPYFKKDIPPTVYTLKYLTRNVVLNAAMDDYDSAQKSLEQIKEHGQTIKSDLIEKKAKPTADKFDASIMNLQKSINKKDMNLIRINGSIVMKNIMLMMDDLTKSM